jgi:hypothetical protein
MTTTELAKWVETAEIDGADVPVPPNLIRGLLAKSVIDNWPRYEIAEDAEGTPVALRFGSPAAANKALEMLAKDAGMLADSVKVSGGIEIRINGVNLDDLS